MIDIVLIADWREPEIEINITKIRRPPARFVGGKYGARGIIFDILAACGGGFDIALDPFGGSGMLSRAIKDSNMANHVVYGDFDDYADRIRYMQSADAVVHHQYVLGLLREVGRDERIPNDIVKSLALYFEGAADNVLTTWIPYLSFSGTNLSNHDITSIGRYNRVPRKWPDAKGWLDGLQVVTGTDARTLIKMFTPTKQRTLVVLDPPYPGTLGSSYRDASWSIHDYEDIINTTLKNGVDTIVAFGDDRSGVESMMSVIPAGKVKRIEYRIRTNGAASGSLDSAYIIRGYRAA